MRTWVLVIGVALLSGCAGGLAPDADITAIIDGGELGGAKPVLFNQEDTICNIVDPGAICEDYHRHNPEPWPLVQYSILCKADVTNFTNCTAWSYDPKIYSDDTWAYCCFPPEAGSPK